ncbi:unnamed protein product [Durusdinium trenchii]|uniref:Protein-serine/threonine phosphatase n=1 Tax=Durusdinium trenchii TaxID=1381693 RepID=A0ABP0Q7N5_9DINO
MAALAFLWNVLCLEVLAQGDMPMNVESHPLGWAMSSELLPGTVVGQGRYVLAEKLCEVCRLPPRTRASEHLALPEPSHRLLLDDGQGQGQVVPYEGLAAAIASDLPNVALSRLAFLPAVHEYAVSHLQRHHLYDTNFRYNFGPRLGRGSFGEAWRAVTLDGSMKEVVLKRLFVEKGEHVRRSGEREIHFGSILQHRHHIARFLESFEEIGMVEEGKKQVELWLVFENEGFSLTHFLFKTQPGSQVVERSTFWWLVKQGLPWGGQVIKNFAYQLLQGLAVAHAANITHRDVKGSNIFVTDTWPPVLRLGDFGSALTTPPGEEVRKLYGLEGPSDDDETSEYKPPEAGLFDDLLLQRVGLRGDGPWRNRSYDMWSLGVLLLELILGTRDLYHVDDRRWLKEEFQLHKNVPEERRAQGRMLLALLDLCLGPRGVWTEAPLRWFFEPELSGPLAGEPRQCSDAEFAERLQVQDAAGVGLPNAAGRDLLRRLLSWDPNERIQAQDALKHPWFDDGVDLPPLRVFKSTANAASGISQVDDEEVTETPETLDGQLSDWSWSEEEDAPALAVWEDEGEEAENSLGGEYTVASSCPGLHAHVASSDDVGRRKAMEDRHSIQNISGSCHGGKAGYVGIFDGHGGDWTASWLARSLHRRLQLRGPRSVSSALEAAFAAFDKARKKEQLEYRNSEEQLGTGSTALVGVLCNCTLHLANLGDCRAVAALRGTWPSKGETTLPEESIWPPGARVEVLDSRSDELRGQRGTVVEVRIADSGPGRPRRVFCVVRLLRDGTLRPFRSQSLRMLSELRAVRLTKDHKPGSPEEKRRIEELGGEIVWLKADQGSLGDATRSARVAGLATSRSFTGIERRPLVTAEPEFWSLPFKHCSEGADCREGEDLTGSAPLFVVLASDGIWDVLEDQLAVDLVWDLLSSAQDPRRGMAGVLQEAAQLVIQAAKDRGSTDNLTCIILLIF